MKRIGIEYHDIGTKVFCVCRNEEIAKCDACGTTHRCGHMTIQHRVVEDVMWTEKSGVRYWIGLQVVDERNVSIDRESAVRRLADLQQDERTKVERLRDVERRRVAEGMSAWCSPPDEQATKGGEA